VAVQRHERVYVEPITDVFAALVRMLALRRWDPTANVSTELVLPSAGCRYERQTDTALRRGRVLEILRPVSVTLQETLYDAPCRVRLKHRWRIHLLEDGSLLRLDLHFEVNQAAALRGLHWHRQLTTHCRKMFSFVQRNLDNSKRSATLKAKRQDCRP
jgi:hypothetical protein